MIIEEGRQVINQMDVDTQVVAESSKSYGQEGKALWSMRQDRTQCKNVSDSFSNIW
jgi:hypothetical protein